LVHLKDGTRSGRLQDHFSVFRDRCEWHLRGRKLITLGFDQSYLPRLTLFTSGKAVTTLEALNAMVHDSNKNMSPLKKLWLHWHIKLGHIGFSHVQKLALGGFLDRISLGLLRTEITDYPCCASCQYGKQKHTPDPTTTVTKNQELIGSLKENQLAPGDRIFCDQLESRVQGRLLHTAGREPDKDRYCGATIFCDAASGYIHAKFQVTLNATDSINALDNFERALHQGVDIKSYHTDNGIFKSKHFVREILTNAKTIRYSGVGAKWQNGVAESAIGLVASTARTNMILAALHWPEVEDIALWPLAVQHATYMYNHTPNPNSGVAPVEIFSRTLSDCQALQNAHPWGVPVYVLQPHLTSADGKLPKWQPRSRRGQFDISRIHAESISLVQNLTTSYISPQYHLVYDDWFEAVYSSLDQEPPEWDNLCTFQRFETHFDEGTAPTLQDEWLTPAETATSDADKRLHGLRQGRKQDWQHASDKDSRDNFSHEPPPPDPLCHPPDPSPISQTREPTSTLPSPPDPMVKTREPSSSSRRQLPSSWNRQTRDDPAPPTNPTRPTCNRAQNQPLNIGTTQGKSYSSLASSVFNRKSFKPLSFLSTAIDRFSGLTPSSSRMLHAQMLGHDPNTGLQEYLPPGISQSCVALKAKASSDPDLPNLRESLHGPYSEEFWKAMDAKIASLEGKGTWEVVLRSSLPPGIQAVPGTWVQRIKRLPSGELSKFKSCWCRCGNLQLYEGVAYSPLVGWPTVQTALLMAATQGWTSRQVDFTLAFCQSPQPADNPLLMELPLPKSWITGFTGQPRMRGRSAPNIQGPPTPLRLQRCAMCANCFVRPSHNTNTPTT